MRRAARSVTVVRPYGARIRRRVFAHLQRAGLEVDEGRMIPPGVSDREAVDAVLRQDPDVLLVPYHGQRGPGGRIADGLSFLRALAARAGGLSRPVLMPVSRFGAAGLELGLQTARLPDAAILVIREEDLDDPGLAARIREHVGP